MLVEPTVITFAKAIADETRQEIMRLLCCEWMSVNDVVAALGGRVNQPTVSHHLKLLTEADLVHVRQEGRHRFYSLNQERFTVCCGSLMQTFAPNYAEQRDGTPRRVPVVLTCD
jgi:DNA-binding transcriptional ArsR family regulator